jgi:hypothetical protein
MLHCAGIEPATSCVVGEYSHHYATSAVSNVKELKRQIMSFQESRKTKNVRNRV